MGSWIWAGLMNAHAHFQRLCESLSTHNGGVSGGVVHGGQESLGWTISSQLCSVAGWRPLCQVSYLPNATVPPTFTPALPFLATGRGGHSYIKVQGAYYLTVATHPKVRPNYIGLSGVQVCTVNTVWTTVTRMCPALMSCHVYLCMCFLWMFWDLWRYWWWFLLFISLSIYLPMAGMLWTIISCIIDRLLLPLLLHIRQNFEEVCRDRFSYTLTNWVCLSMFHTEGMVQCKVGQTSTRLECVHNSLWKRWLPLPLTLLQWSVLKLTDGVCSFKSWSWRLTSTTSPSEFLSYSRSPYTHSPSLFPLSPSFPANSKECSSSPGHWRTGQRVSGKSC